MKLAKLIAIADAVYPGGMIQEAFDSEVPGRGVGDGLAEFIALELEETYDASASSLDQIKEAYRVMSTAHTELGDVARAFSDLEGELESKRRQTRAKK